MSDYNGKCDVISPEGAYGCTKIVNHESLLCMNTSVKKTWCGDCMLWSCYHFNAQEMSILHAHVKQNKDQLHYA